MNILVLGDAILDKYVYGNINRMSPEDSSIPILDVLTEDYRLGGCMNVAANIRSISTPKWTERHLQTINVSLSSVFSQFTGDILQRKGILSDNSCILQDQTSGIIEPSPRELVKTRYINKETKKQILRVDNRLHYDYHDVELYKSVFEDTGGYDAIVVSDYSKGLVNGFTLERLKNFKGPIFIDSKNPDLSFWNCLSSSEVFIKKNEKEYSISHNSTHHKVIVTRGEKGCSVINWPVEAFSVKPVKDPDVVGAGDVFMAGLVVNYMRHKDLNFAIEFANMCASISCQQQGTTEVYL